MNYLLLILDAENIVHTPTTDKKQVIPLNVRSNTIISAPTTIILAPNTIFLAPNTLNSLTNFSSKLQFTLNPARMPFHFKRAFFF